ncbi:aspartyl-phosphate phosphatase Spo0E family protein [Pullulanibacillus sp. KACC 23026]|uniref:aspartyl-phosphate phosphatase Spo0E family protein n=1 Tax=Pullulanibacillus sp. KACC 23026 TaxID=3028315 RepID=UPI0023B1F3A1|nr:aspartyl-phosphate phosphatase Spo0E family protein [Pullulanibacillus sp. KACC 23026]WEG13476.1 aspartyl-phosphate phosphatase Spo0E family protein [Pullulanibacillus sp. KACC 23026]
MDSLKDCYLKLSKLRREMIKKGLEKGFNHEDTLAISKKMDAIILEIQKEENKL